MFFFDEAHLLFDDAPKALLEKIEQVVRLIRSKGVGVYFVTQNPLDIPDTVLGQLGNRVQHALRAFTPRDQKAVKTAAETLRAESEARRRAGDHRARRRRGAGLASSTRRARPRVVERAFVVPPGSQLGPISRRGAPASAIAALRVCGQVREDRRPRIGLREAQGPRAGEAAAETPRRRSRGANPVSDILFGKTGPRGGQQSQGLLEAMAKSAARTIGSAVGREIVRGVLGSILGGKRRR